MHIFAGMRQVSWWDENITSQPWGKKVSSIMSSSYIPQSTNAVHQKNKQKPFPAKHIPLDEFNKFK